MRKLFLLLSLLLVLAPLAGAKEAILLADPDIDEERYKALASELRCQKCQNQTIYDSKAGLADDMKKVIRTQMKEGKSDQEIVDFLVARYGDFIRYKPDFKSSTALLWVGPFLLLIIGVVMLFVQMNKRRQQIVDAPLSADESARVDALIKRSSGES